MLHTYLITHTSSCALFVSKGVSTNQQASLIYRCHPNALPCLKHFMHVYCLLPPLAPAFRLYLPPYSHLISSLYELPFRADIGPLATKEFSFLSPIHILLPQIPNYSEAFCPRDNRPSFSPYQEQAPPSLSFRHVAFMFPILLRTQLACAEHPSPTHVVVSRTTVQPYVSLLVMALLPSHSPISLITPPLLRPLTPAPEKR